MAFAFVQNVQVLQSSAVTSVVITVSSVGLNHLLVVNFKLTSGASNPSVTDNASTPNTYAMAVNQLTSGIGDLMWQFYGVAKTAGATSVTISWTGNATGRLSVNEFSGNALSNAAVFDVASSGFNSSAVSSSSVPFFGPRSNGELIVAAIDTPSAVSAQTAGAGYTLANSAGSMTEEYRLSSTTSENAPASWTGTTAWIEVAGAYLPLNPVYQSYLLSVNRSNSHVGPMALRRKVRQQVPRIAPGVTAAAPNQSNMFMVL